MKPSRANTHLEAAGPGRLGVALVGIGAVGSSLALSLHQSGYRVLALIDRSREAAAAAAGRLDVDVASDNLADIPTKTRLVFICTREDAISGVIDGLLRTSIDWSQSVVAHVSGRQPASVLAPLADHGARVLSFHPLGAFPPGSTDKTLSGLTIGLEGDPDAVAVGAAIAIDLGAKPVEIPTSAKAAYHLAAVMTSNFLVTLMGDVRRLLAHLDLPADLTHSLAQDTLDNLRSAASEDALTGPIARADKEALAEQLAIMSQIAPELVERFISLAEGTIDLAARSGRVSQQERIELRNILKCPE